MVRNQKMERRIGIMNKPKKIKIDYTDNNEIMVTIPDNGTGIPVSFLWISIPL